VWKDNFRHVEQLFNYGSDVRRVMYTTNAIESVNSSFRKVTKKGAFNSEIAVFKVFYLRIKELYQKWQGHSIRSWAMVMNQLIIDERIGAMVQKYQASI
jgi:transposase-like protein